MAGISVLAVMSCDANSPIMAHDAFVFATRGFRKLPEYFPRRGRKALRIRIERWRRAASSCRNKLGKT
jgi:hypothetical protein